MNLRSPYPENYVRRNKQAGYWTDETFGEMLRKHTAQRPNEIALISSNKRLTWSELSTEMERTAGGLKKIGIKEGDTVSVQLANSTELVVLILAIWEIGAIYQPLNPLYRYAELSTIVGALRPHAIVCRNETKGFNYLELIEEVTKDLNLNAHKICVDYSQPGWISTATFDKADFTPTKPDPFRTALLGTTSGTTGNPKIYIHIQATQIFEAKALCEGLQVNNKDVTLAAAPLTHRGALMVGLMTSLISGSALAVGDASDTRAIAQLIAEEHVTMFMGIPTIVSDLLLLHVATAFDASSLRVVVTSGAPVTPELIGRFNEAWPHAVPASGYGLTETGWCTFLRLDDPPSKIFTSGRLAPATEIEIRSSKGAPLPAGEVGEIHIRGPMTCAGYFKNSEATKTSIDENEWFASGDLGLLDDDGFLQPVGRSKHMIIRGGLNIYAEEIERLIQEHPAVAEVVVIGIPHHRLGEQACACVVLKPDQIFEIRDVQKFLEEKKTAKYTWPERVEVFGELPRNPIGKFDRIQITKSLMERI